MYNISGICMNKSTLGIDLLSLQVVIHLIIYSENFYKHSNEAFSSIIIKE